MTSKLPVVAILGAGKLGVTLGQLARKAGYEVYIAGSGSVDKIKLTVEVLAPGAVASTSKEAVKKADIIVLALPLSKYRNIPKEELAGKLVVDAMNYWWEVDGPREDFIPLDMSTSEAVQEYLSKSRVVKALNHMGYHDLHDEPRPKGETKRKAIAVAGDDDVDVKQVMELVDNLGFDPLHIGNLAKGVKLEAGTKAFGANVNLSELKSLVQSQD